MNILYVKSLAQFLRNVDLEILLNINILKDTSLIWYASVDQYVYLETHYKYRCIAFICPLFCLLLLFIFLFGKNIFLFSRLNLIVAIKNSLRNIQKDITSVFIVFRNNDRNISSKLFNGLIRKGIQYNAERNAILSLQNFVIYSLITFTYKIKITTWTYLQSRLLNINSKINWITFQKESCEKNQSDISPCLI